MLLQLQSGIKGHAILENDHDHSLSHDFTIFFSLWLYVQDWDQCEKGIAASHEKLRDFKQKLSVPLPDHHEELHTEQIRCKVHKRNLTHLVSYDLLETC